MKFDPPEDLAARELRRLREQNDRLFGGMSVKAVLDAAKSPAEHLGLPESAWQQVQREMKLQEEVEKAERFGLPKSAWDEVQQHAKLQDEAKRALGVGSVASYLDDQTRASILGTITPTVGEALRQMETDRSEEIVYTPPPLPDFNAGPNLLREQIEISRQHLETAQQGQRDAERRESESARREQDAIKEASRQRRIARISAYIAFAAFLGWAATYLYDKL